MRYKDHLGQEFPTKTSMCKAYGVSVGLFNKRYENGYDLAGCLNQMYSETEKKYVRLIVYKYEDHLGNKFASIEKMCKHWCVSVNKYSARIKFGATVEEALTKEERKKYKDHLGNRFKEVREMCAYWGVPQSIYNYRKKQGYRLEDCLDKDYRKKRYENYGSFRGVHILDILETLGIARGKCTNYLRGKEAYIRDVALWQSDMFLGYTEDGDVLVVFETVEKLSVQEYIAKLKVLSALKNCVGRCD